MKAIFSIFDSKAQLFMLPFFAPNRAVASRMFQGVINDPTTDFSKFPGDFALFELGLFDESDGRLEPLGAPQSVVLGASLVQDKE